MNDSIDDVFLDVSEKFCREFVSNPYLCYTEHGLHALFYTRLFSAIPDKARYIEYRDHKVCVVQKEYPTAGRLVRSRRQHWDIALVKAPPVPKPELKPSYDYLRLSAVAEFGLNATLKHLEKDRDRITDTDANLERGFLFHFFRLSDGKSPVSGRDMSPKSKHFVSAESVLENAKERVNGWPVTLFLAIADQTKPHSNAAWCITADDTRKLV